MPKLSSIKSGTTVHVVRIINEKNNINRILNMGITVGTKLFIRKRAPLGDPIEINLRGYELSIRKSDANQIIVE